VSRRSIVIVAAVTLTVAAAAGAGLAIAGGDEEVARGPEADRAAAAAVRHAGGGRAVEVVRDEDDGGGYEVEVQRPDGSAVEVDLSADGTVRASEPNDDRPGERDDEGRDDDGRDDDGRDDDDEDGADDDARGGAAAGAASTRLPAHLDPRNFTANITHAYWPMRPGSRWVYRKGDRRTVVTVTTRTEVVDGVRARVVRDVVRENGRVHEDTTDWYAQDRAGNLWYLGERTVEYDERGRGSTEGSWRAGTRGARAGIALPARPQVGMRFQQEQAPDAADTAQILSLNEQADVAAGHFGRLLMTKDFSPLEPRVLEFKLYAKGVGPVMVLDVSGGNGGREELVRYDR
jgi:hypothetical protein